LSIDSFAAEKCALALLGAVIIIDLYRKMLSRLLVLRTIVHETNKIRIKEITIDLKILFEILTSQQAAAMQKPTLAR